VKGRAREKQRGGGRDFNSSLAKIIEKLLDGSR
jgi:hypothetical protein